MTIIEYGDYIAGKKSFPKMDKPTQRCNKLVVCLAEVYKNNFAEIEMEIPGINTPAMFYKMFPEVRKYKIIHRPNSEDVFRLEEGVIITNLPETEVANNFYDEVFYCMRVQIPNEYISCRQLFHLEKYAEMFNKDFSWLPKLYPESLLTELLSSGYIANDTTLQTFISSYFAIDYKPLSTYERCVKAADGTWRLYEPDTDAVVSIPESLKERLSFDNMCNIGFDGTYVTLDGKPLHTLKEGCLGVYRGGNSYNLVSCL